MALQGCCLWGKGRFPLFFSHDGKETKDLAPSMLPRRKMPSHPRRWGGPPRRANVCRWCGVRLVALRRPISPTATKGSAPTELGRWHVRLRQWRRRPRCIVALQGCCFWGKGALFSPCSLCLRVLFLHCCFLPTCDAYGIVELMG